MAQDIDIVDHGTVFRKGGWAMLVDYGSERLRRFSEREHEFHVVSVGSNCIFVAGLGHSNAAAIAGNESVILIDTLDSVERATTLRKIIEDRFHKPVRTIIYTHGHPDHRGGAGVFKDTAREVIAFQPQRPALEHYDQLKHALYKRADYQFGYHLNDEELISMGIGKREKGTAIGEGDTDYLPPTTEYQTPNPITRVFDGVELQMVPAPGECDDEIFIWYGDGKAMFCGDNYYACWPNLYALRGTQYRDVAAWVNSLDKIRAYPAQYLLPGHTQAVQGEERIRTVLKNYRDAIEWVLLETLNCIDKGYSVSRTVETVRLPETLRNLPYLGEYYGTVAWSVRSIYSGYVGWFDGNPSDLNRLPDETFNRELVELMTPEHLCAAIKSMLEQRHFQMATQLCDILLSLKANNQQAKQWKATALRGLSDQETAASGRHYYINCAKELER